MTLAEAPAPVLAAPARSWIGNREVEGRGGRRPAVNPATGQAFAEVSLLDAEQAGQALEVARAAFPAWSRRPFRERAQVLLAVRDRLLARSDEIAALIAREQGKPVAEAQVVEVFPCLDALQHLAQHAEELLREDALESHTLLFAHKEARLVYAPLGVVLAITPWNYPLSISLTSVAAALIAGNTVALKPAPATTLVGLAIGRLFQEAGAPEGVVNVLAVDDTVAAALVEDARVAKIVFTGSVATGRKVMAAAARNLTPVVLELGGKDAAVVARDADLDRTAKGVVWGAFFNAGQTCASVERVYVERPVAEAFLTRVVEETRRLRVGDPSSPEVDMGPLTLESQRRLVDEHVADAVARGARVLTGGRMPDGPGWFYPPTVLTEVDHGMRIMREESFGPVLPVMVVDDLEQAVRLANDSEYGLTASAWTRDEATAGRLQEQLHAGVVTVNDCVFSYGEPTAPWGGVKNSGFGRTHGLHGLREMVQVKYVSSEYDGGPNLWWYPYGEDFRRLVSEANRALHSRSLFTRLRAQLGLLASPRFRGRARLRALFSRADKLF